MMVLHPPVISLRDAKARVSSVITDENTVSELWFEVDAEHKFLLPTETMDAFVIGCLLPAMKLGKDIMVKGAMSSRLYYNLRHLLIATLREYLPNAQAISINAERLLTSYADRAHGVLAGFSGGVDSFCNYYDHSHDRAPPEFHLTHFLYNNVGSHGQCGPERDYAVFDAHAAAIKRFADQEGKPLITVNSNLDAVIGMDFQLTHTIRNVAVALLLQKAASKFLYPSCSQIRYTEVKPSHDIAGLDPIILPLLSTERMDCIASGGQYTRTEKAVRVANIPTSWTFLDVCVEPYKAKPGTINCSVCWKCMRTQLTFDVIGKLDHYRDVFDIRSYQLYKNIFIIDVLNSRNNHQEDLAAFMRAHHFPIPPRVRLVAKLMPRYLAERLAKRFIPVLTKHPRLRRLCNCILGA